MKRNEGKYRIVDKLPKGAQTVAEYCASKNITPAAVYMRIKRGRADFEIVIFQGINFVIAK